MKATREPSTVRRVWSARRIALLVASALMVAAGLSAFSTSAFAAFAPVPTAQGPHLSLQSDPQPAEFMDMSPGSVEHWQISAALVDPTSTLTVQFSRAGALVTNPRGLWVEVDRCDQAWTDVSTTPVCGSGAVNVFGPVSANAVPDMSVYDLAGLTNAHDKYLLVTLSIPDSAAAESDTSLMGLTATMGFGLTATGVDQTSPGNPSSPTGPTSPGSPGDGSLAFTGVDSAGLLLLAFGALGLGLVILGARKARFALPGKASK